jgi:NTP pyrophosphatase (non-canonical NTP hydrolase)
MMAVGPSLDEIYRMTAYIYSEQNAQRATSATFAHFVEVCGILSMRARKKKREGVTFEDAICKALGWYFPLMAKFKVRSVEELIFRKYPYACPYCRECPHMDENCKTVIGTQQSVNHTSLREKYIHNRTLRPHGINDWQKMFHKVYPRSPDDSSRSVVGLFEELGELAEAVRVFDRHPKYFIGEAADVFSYLMGLANEYAIQQRIEGAAPFDLEREFLKRYPGLCMQCGYQVCICPLVPDSTVGRMAKELELETNHQLFASNFEEFREESIKVSEAALQRSGGFAGLTSALPFDRGEANRQFVTFCLEVADKIEDPEIAPRLRSAALKAATAIIPAGTRQQPKVLDSIVAPVQKVFEENRPKMAEALGIKDEDLQQNVTVYIANEVITGNKYVSGHSINTSSGGQTVIQEMQEAWRQLGPSADLHRAARELAELRTQFEASGSLAGTESVRAQIDRAEEAAKQGNGPKALAALKGFGRVALEFAIQAGSGLAVEMIKKANGI